MRPRAQTTACVCWPGTRPRRRRYVPAPGGPAPTTASTPSILTARSPRRTPRLRRRGRPAMRPHRDGACTYSPRPRSWPAPAGDLLAQSGAMADEMGNAFQQAWQHIAFGTAKADVGELADAAKELQKGISIARRVGDPAVEIWGCSCWALVELSRGNMAELRAIADGMDRPGRPLGETGATVLDALRLIAADIDHAAAALRSLGELLLTSNDPPDGARMILLGATLALRAGDRAGARAAAERSLAGCEQLGSALTGACRVFLARLDRRDGAAEQQAHAGLAEITDAGLWAEVPDALELLGGLAIDSGSFAEGARLLAAATALHERMGQRCWLAGEAEGDRARAAAELGDDFPSVAAEGQRLGGPAAVAYARRARGERR